MPPAKMISLRFTAEQVAALEAHCAATGRSMSDVIRDAAMDACGAPTLKGVMPPAHRPKVAEQSTEPPKP